MVQDHFWNLLAKKLAGEASDGELEEMASLIKAYPELSYAAQHVADIWCLEQPENKAEAEKAFQKHIQRLEAWNPFATFHGNEEDVLGKTFTKRKWVFPAFVFLIAVAACAAIFIFTNAKKAVADSSPKLTEEVYARPGTKTKLVLPDSSVVWLNAGSKLTYTKPFGIKERVVTLSGEAYFDVTKSATPFIIHTSGAHIRVLGTVFNVRSYANEKRIETSLISGQVEVTIDKSPEKKYVLRPSEKLTLNTEESPKKISKKAHAPLAVLSGLHYIDSTTIAEISWIENKLIFTDESFADIAKKMERWYGITIRFQDEGLQREILTGKFERETVAQALQALQISTPFEFVINNSEITISTKQ